MTQGQKAKTYRAPRFQEGGCGTMAGYDDCYAHGTLQEVLEAAGYTIYENIYLSLMGRFECADKEAERFLSDCILERLLSTNVTLSMSEYEQTVYNIMSFEYGIFTDGKEYFLVLREELDCCNEGIEECNLVDNDFKIIIGEIEKNVKHDFE